MVNRFNSSFRESVGSNLKAWHRFGENLPDFKNRFEYATIEVDFTMIHSNVVNDTCTDPSSFSNI